MSLNLSLLGLELDQLRRSRGDPTYSPTPSGEAELPTSPTLESETASSISPSSSPIQTTRHLAGHAEPYPLCLLCFSRTPSAVLLPCAHLNLCYLCAPLLIAKARPPPCVREDDAPPRRDRVPYNLALSRALASRRASGGPPGAGAPTRRRMSMGGYVAPKEGIAGGEMRGADVLPPGTVAGTSPPQESRLACEFDPAGGGRVRLSLAGQQVAQCLVCRQGVSGWLRVYTG